MNEKALTKQKLSGAYYTPEAVVRSLVSWATRGGSGRLLDPACGDGRFLAAHSNSYGIERDEQAVRAARCAAPHATVLTGDFFTWAESSAERFDCVAGNPPFIRYQTFAGETRRRALDICGRLGAQFSGLASSWAPFIVAATGLLKLDGRIAFVVPAEIGHAPYAAPLLEYLAGSFRRVQVVAVREKLFPELSEDCWLLYAEGHGGTADELEFTVCERFAPSAAPPQPTLRIPLDDWRAIWGRRLRPMLLPSPVRNLYQLASVDAESHRLRDIASIRIGYVSGANDFFHLRPSEAAEWRIPREFLTPTVRNGKALPQRELAQLDVDRWLAADEPVLLLRLPSDAKLPPAVAEYLDCNAGHEARRAFKCRTRTPWWSVPDVRIPDYYLSYMSGAAPALVRNAGGASCTNSVHALQSLDERGMRAAHAAWSTPFVRLSCEVEGHPLGGGMLKLEVREAGRILFPAAALGALMLRDAIDEALTTMQRWRHRGE
ncbi:MAG TPA: N-6 DNA methylase [Caulobacteraceae bacterium]|jgi:predicted RNA methylase